MLKQAGSATTFVRLLPTTLAAQGLREKVMEQWLAENPRVVLPEEERALVISQETAFQNLVDILAIDQQGNCLIIEIKRGQTPRDVIAQALEYCSDVEKWDYQQLNARALAYFKKQGTEYDSLLSAFQATFDLDSGDFDESRFNLGQRVFIVAEAIEERIERTARWLLRRGVDIACIKYECFRTDDGELFLDFQEIVKREEAQEPPGEVRRARPAARTEAELADGLPPATRDLYEELKRRAQAFGQDVETGATSSYLKFVAGRNFAELHAQKDGLRIYVRPEGFKLAERESREFWGIAVTRVPDSQLWTLNHWFQVRADTDMDAAERLLRQSYNAVHG